MSSKVQDPEYARRVLAEAAERAKRKKRVSLDDLLFGNQLAFVKSPAKRKAAVCSRRAGKSYGVAMQLIEAGFKYANSFPLYVTMGRSLAKNIIWPALIDINAKCDLGLEFKQNSGDVVFPNGSRILLRGAGSIREIDKLRGPKYPVAVVDEAQGFGNNLTYLLEEVIEPATMDYNGIIILAGTPNAACAGPFYERVTMSSKGWEVHHWTFRDNPHLQDPEAWIQRLMRERGWTEETTAYRREYRGEWVRDAEGLVYNIDEARNIIPFFDSSVAHDWLYYLGIDLGFNDPTAFAVLASSEDRREIVLVESYEVGKLTPSKAAAHVERLQERYNFSKIVADTGGFGKGYVEEWRDTYGMNVEAAQKRDKFTYIEMMNSDLRSGVMKIAKDKNRDYLLQANLLQWDMDNRDSKGQYREDARFQNHLADAVLYAKRECKPHGGSWTAEAPRPGDRDWWAYREKQLMQRLLDEKAKPWWKKLKF